MTLLLHCVPTAITQTSADLLWNEPLSEQSSVQFESKTFDGQSRKCTWNVAYKMSAISFLFWYWISVFFCSVNSRWIHEIYSPTSFRVASLVLGWERYYHRVSDWHLSWPSSAQIIPRELYKYSAIAIDTPIIPPWGRYMKSFVSEAGISCWTLHWRHNERFGVSNHQPYGCLHNCLFKAQIKENIKAPRHWPLCGEFTGDRWIPHTKGQ